MGVSAELVVTVCGPPFCPRCGRPGDYRFELGGLPNIRAWRWRCSACGGSGPAELLGMGWSAPVLRIGDRVRMGVRLVHAIDLSDPDGRVLVEVVGIEAEPDGTKALTFRHPPTSEGT